MCNIIENPIIVRDPGCDFYLIVVSKLIACVPSESELLFEEIIEPVMIKHKCNRLVSGHFDARSETELAFLYWQPFGITIVIQEE